MTSSYRKRADLRQGKDVVQDTFGQSSRDWIATAEASYGFTDRLALQATLPVISASFAGEALGVDYSQTKLGDFSLTAHFFRSFGYFAAPVMLSLGAGVNIPTGRGIENPVSSDRNFVSGTWDPVFTGSLVFSIQGPLSASVNFYARPILFEAGDSTKTGGFIFAGVGAGYSFIFSDNSGLDLSLRASGLHRAQDKINDQPFANSGGNWIYLTPGSTVSFFGRGIHGLQFSTALEFPVYQYVKGSQLTEDWALRFGLGYGFHLISGGG